MQDLLDILADVQPAERLEIGQAVEEQDALGEPVGVLHLVDRFGALELGELVHAPIVEQPVVQPILVGRGQLVLERLVESSMTLGSPFIAASVASGGAMRCQAAGVKSGDDGASGAGACRAPRR